MIPFETALQTILEQAKPLGIVRRSLENLLGMVLAEAVEATFDLPRFDNSAVDGFGVLMADVEGASSQQPVILKLTRTIQAGDSGKVRLQRGETIKILTGAPVPASVDAVIMQEFTETEGNTVRILATVEKGENIRRKGEEFRKGQPIIAAGLRVTPPIIGLLATLGKSSAWVYKKPRVGLISTGNELVKPGKPLKSGQIYDSNSVALSAALKAVGIEMIRLYQAQDDRNATRRAFEKALAENDVIISLGGISVGEFDFVKDVAEQLKIETLFWRISIKPGKPVYFGKAGRKLVFGLPGNPVSALVTYHQLVEPALLQMMGLPCPVASARQATLLEPLHKKAGRQEFVRGIAAYDDNDVLTVKPSIGQDSHMLGGLAAANCLINFPLSETEMQQGDKVAIQWLSWAHHGV